MAPTPASLECEIILVEDNPHDAELTMRVLRSGNAALRLAWVRDGVEALELLLGAGNGAGRASRIVLLDLKLPRLDGHEVLKRLKADPRTRSIPVIVLTSSGERSDLVRAYGDATKAVLEILPRAEKVPTHTTMLALPYNLLEQVRLLVGEWNGRILDEQFAAEITMTMQFTVAKFPGFQDALRELSHGSLAAEIIETNEDTIMPLGTFADETK